MVVDVITDLTGLVRWVDYIPVKQTAASPHIPNSYDVDGAMELDVLGDTTGLQAGLDYMQQLRLPGPPMLVVTFL
jgi:hypothetical protein